MEFRWSNVPLELGILGGVRRRWAEKGRKRTKFHLVFPIDNLRRLLWLQSWGITLREDVNVESAVMSCEWERYARCLARVRVKMDESGHNSAILPPHSHLRDKIKRADRVSRWWTKIRAFYGMKVISWKGFEPVFFSTRWTNFSRKWSFPGGRPDENGHTQNLRETADLRTFCTMRSGYKFKIHKRKKEKDQGSIDQHHQTQNLARKVAP